MKNLMDNPMTFGYVMMFLLFILAMSIAIGHVQQESSFGLRDVITIIGVIAGSWSQQAFTKAFAKKDDEQK